MIQSEIRTTAILAGGRSRRFGSNKALASWRGERVIDAVVQAAVRASHCLFIVANDPSPYTQTGIPVHGDLLPGKGPLAGLHTALLHLQGQRVFLLGCDMPLVNPSFMAAMWNMPTRSPVLIPRGPTGLEPLHAIYHISLLPLVEERLAAGRLGLQALLRGVPYQEIPSDVVAAYCPDFRCLANANTPEELEELKGLFEERS